MSRKLKGSLSLVTLLALVLPLSWATLSLTFAGDADVDAEAPVGLELAEAPAELGPINVPLQDALYRSGLDPEALAAAGVTPVQVDAMASALRTDLIEVQPLLVAADADVAQGRTSVGQLSRLVRSGKGAPEDVASLAQCKADCDAALAERDNCLDHFHAAACAVLPAAQRDALVNIRANRKWKAPTPYLVVNRTPEQWMQLEEYLDVERIEARWGHELDQEVTTVLSAVRADAAYASATVAYDSNIDALKVAANSAIRD